MCIVYLFFFKQKTAYEMLISDCSSDFCSSDLCRQLLVCVDNSANCRFLKNGCKTQTGNLSVQKQRRCILLWGFIAEPKDALVVHTVVGLLHVIRHDRGETDSVQHKQQHSKPQWR